VGDSRRPTWQAKSFRSAPRVWADFSSCDRNYICHPSTVPAQQKQEPASEHQEAEQLRALVQQFVRRFGVLVTRRTPCGFPVSPSYAHALMLLRRRTREGLTTQQSDLAGTLGIDKSNVARLCERMVKAGHAIQTVPPEDGRSRAVALTAKGSRLAERIETGSRDRFAAVTAGIPRSRRAAVIAALADLNAAVETTAEGDSQ
jgi:DNA-binding MarR family transcriptional regulator